MELWALIYVNNMFSKGNTGAQIEKQLNWQPKFCQFPAKSSTLKAHRTISQHEISILASSNQHLTIASSFSFKKFHENYSRKITFFNVSLLSY